MDHFDYCVQLVNLAITQEKDSTLFSKHLQGIASGVYTNVYAGIVNVCFIYFFFKKFNNKKKKKDPKFDRTGVTDADLWQMVNKGEVFNKPEKGKISAFGLYFILSTIF